MTDFTWNNLKFWNDHDGLRLYLDCGQLDVAIFDAVNDESIKSASIFIKNNDIINLGFTILI